MIPTRADETRPRGDCYEAGDSPGAETNSRPLALETIIPQHPCQATNTRGQVGDDASLDSTQVGAQRRPTVKTKPAKPEENGAENDVRGVVWFIGETRSAVATTLPKKYADGQSGRAG
jgi:hypothetical protein